MKKTHQNRSIRLRDVTERYTQTDIHVKLMITALYLLRGLTMRLNP